MTAAPSTDIKPFLDALAEQNRTINESAARNAEIAQQAMRQAEQATTRANEANKPPPVQPVHVDPNIAANHAVTQLPREIMSMIESGDPAQMAQGLALQTQHMARVSAEIANAGINQSRANQPDPNSEEIKQLRDELASHKQATRSEKVAQEINDTIRQVQPGVLDNKAATALIRQEITSYIQRNGDAPSKEAIATIANAAAKEVGHKARPVGLGDAASSTRSAGSKPMSPEASRYNSMDDSSKLFYLRDQTREAERLTRERELGLPTSDHEYTSTSALQSMIEIMADTRNGPSVSEQKGFLKDLEANYRGGALKNLKPVEKHYNA